MTRPDPHQPSGRPHSNTRRKFLVALGFGVTNVGLLRELGSVPSAEPADAGDPVEDAVRTGPDPLPGTEIADAPDQLHDIVIANGRVIDPDTGFDGIADVGMTGASITAVGPGLRGAQVIDAAGQVVAPGFIDILSAEPHPVGVWFKVADGVTTNMAMHGVNNYANAFFRNFEGKTPVHFGGAWHQHFIRGEDEQVGAVMPEDSLVSEQIAEFADLTRLNLANGLAGVSFSPEYSPGTSRDEMEALARVAVERGHGAFFHVRYSDPDSPGTSLEALEEVLQIARDTGVWVHVEHLASTGGTFVMDEAIALLESGRAEGLDVTADIYPYDFWGTTVASNRFAGDWRTRYRISFEDLQVAGTNELLNEVTFEEAQAQNLLVAALGSIPEEEVQKALGVPWIMIGSDAILTGSSNHHPRGAGTFSRVLGRYVRELGVLSLPDALAKMTILPARRLEGMIPAMATKGRLRRGADADVVVFDPTVVGDRATIAAPNTMSVGFSHVFVDGQAVLSNGDVQRDVLPGRALRSA
jgi:N-acyl-D-aspartate/D-glutamate deacylase